MSQKAVAYFGIGSGGNADTANIQWNIAESGWGNFINRSIFPCVHLGWTEFWLHNPFGAWIDPVYDGNTNMQLDQWFEVHENTDMYGNIEKVATTFADNWRFVRDAFQGIEVTAYIGKLPGDPDFEQYIENGKLHLWLERFTKAVTPLLEVGMNIGLDALATPNVHEEHYAYGAAVMLKDLLDRTEKKLYVEPITINGDEHWDKFPSISFSDFIDRFDRNYPELVDIFLRESTERHMIFHNHNASLDSYRYELKKYVDRGFTPMYPGYKILNGQERYETIVNELYNRPDPDFRKLSSDPSYRIPPEGTTRQ